MPALLTAETRDAAVIINAAATVSQRTASAERAGVVGSLLLKIKGAAKAAITMANPVTKCAASGGSNVQNAGNMPAGATAQHVPAASRRVSTQSTSVARSESMLLLNLVIPGWKMQKPAAQSHIL